MARMGQVAPWVKWVSRAGMGQSGGMGQLGGERLAGWGGAAADYEGGL
jgi:hypothetical protein